MVLSEKTVSFVVKLINSHLAAEVMPTNLNSKLFSTGTFKGSTTLIVTGPRLVSYVGLIERDVEPKISEIVDAVKSNTFPPFPCPSIRVNFGPVP